MQIEQQGGGIVLRRADARHRRPHADRRRPGRRQHPRRRQADERPRLYATFLLWLLSELFENLPEVGDLDKPKLVFFFDEAHLLFRRAGGLAREASSSWCGSSARKGVGVYFVTQNPLDIPDTVLGQLGNRVQHALRAFTPRDQKAVKSAARRCAPTPSSTSRQRSPSSASARRWSRFLDEKGRPSVTERVYVLPPGSQIGPSRPRSGSS
jgi:uncharacterized protein